VSFAAVGLRLPTAFGRAVLAVVVGLAGLVVAIFALSHVEAYEGFLLVSNQQLYVGVLASAIPAIPAIGDITFIVGFVLAFALYAALRPVLNKRAAGAA
jgi:ABC-type lipoprotein release transport system permease subunit